MQYFSELVVVILITLVALYFYLFYLTKNLDYWKVRNVPHRKPLILVGNLLDVILGKISTDQCLKILYNQFKGPYFGFFGTNKPFLVVKDPNIIKHILVKDFYAFRDKAFFGNEEKDPIFSLGIFALKNPKWHVLRSKMRPIFTPGNIKKLLPLIKKSGEDMCTYVNGKQGEKIDVKEIAGRYTLDVAASCVFGIETNPFTTDDNPFRNACDEMFAENLGRSIQHMSYLFAHNLVKPFGMKFFPNKTVNCLREAFMQAVKDREDNKISRNDLAEAMIALKGFHSEEANFKFNEDALTAQVVTLCIAANETSSLTIACTLLELAKYPDVQERLRKEILDVTECYGGLTYEAIQDMKYLQMIISETLRKYVVTSLLHRECTQDVTIPEVNFKIERGLGIIIPLHSLHQDPLYFPDPDKFEPERFSESNKSKIVPYSYLPFGLGPRSCLGERLGMLMSQIGIVLFVLNYRLETTTDTKYPIVIGRSYIAQPIGGIPLYLKKIQD